jgi:hypothetical protein
VGQDPTGEPKDALAWAASLGLSADDLSQSKRRCLSGPGLRAFLKIAERWQLSADERASALAMTGSGFEREADAAATGDEIELPVDVLLRISAILGIYKKLATMFDEGEQVNWLGNTHDAAWSGGRRPKDIIVSGSLDALLGCRRYLDQLCGW